MLVETTSVIAGAITGAIRTAAQITGAGFDYLLATARIESGLNPAVKARTSSASGLFQFIDQTWLATLKQSGPGLGYGRYAAAIAQTASGRHFVRDPQMRAQIMSLRNDPTANAVMAGAFTRGNAARLTAKLGRPPSEGELYMAHFLGSAGAGRLISAAQQAPGEKAARLFPRAAAANRAIFYNKQGGARSVAQVYDVLAAKLARARGGAPQVAQVAMPMPRPMLAPEAISAQMSQPLAASPRRSATIEIAALPPLLPPLPANAATSPPQVGDLPAHALQQSAAPSRPVFHNLFHDDGRGPVSAVVAELWGGKPATGPVGASQSQPDRKEPLDVFGLTQHRRAQS